jgi:hypothetical protein
MKHGFTVSGSFVLNDWRCGTTTITPVLYDPHVVTVSVMFVVFVQLFTAHRAGTVSFNYHF